ncbi:hypothetical protein IMZ48_09475 [Candidatus Bathyarchaeota archaeon]|nr:hypothetical protein [Candidatus Bathyarchaeota archaeon]
MVTAVAFSEDGQYLKTNRGLLSINSNPDSSNTSENRKRASRFLFVSNEWIAQDGKNLLWLPPSYRATCAAVYDGTLVLGHATGGMTFLYF